MEAKEVKKRLLEENRIETLLEEIGCSYIKLEQRGELVTAQLPDSYESTNKRSVQVYMNEFLTAKIRTISDFEGDIFTLVSYLNFDKRGSELESDFKNSINFISDLFGFKKGGYTKKTDYVKSLKALASKSKKSRERFPNPPLDESVLNNFIPTTIESWIKEGIDIDTQHKYEIGFDLDSHRISIPIRNEKNDLVGVKGRLIRNSDVGDYIPKYQYLFKCNISQEWFNLNNAQDYIIKEKRVYIFESEKSVMKMYANGIYNCLAISSSDISDVQVTMIRRLGLDMQIVLCYDKDKSKKEVKKNAFKFKNRETFSILDVNNLLGQHDSPIDKGIEVWNKLLKDNCYKIKHKEEM